MQKIPRLLIIFGITIIVATIIVGIVSIARLANTGNRVNTEIASLKAKGDPTKLSDLAHPPISDDKNAALVFNEIFKKYPKLDCQIKSKSKTDPSKFMQEARIEIAKYPGLIPMVEKALARPDMDFKLEWNKGIELDLKHYEKLRAISRILAAESIVNTIEGSQQRALHYIELNMKLEDMLKDEHTDMGQLIRYSCISVNDSAVERYASQFSVSEDTAKTLYDRLGKLDFQKGLVDVVKSERVMGLSIIDDFVENLRKEIKKPVRKPNFLFFNYFISINKKYVLEKSDKYISLSHLPYYKFKNKWTESNDENPPTVCMLAVFRIPSWHLISRRDEMKARVGGTRIFIALHTYKHKYGKYPDSLDTLQNKLGWKIPQDPFNDKSYHYAQKGNGFVFYSIGKDLKDTHGVDKHTSYQNQKSSSDAEPDYDIVWKSDK